MHISPTSWQPSRKSCDVGVGSAGLSVALPVSVEMDEDACRTVRYSWPDTVEAGDVKNLNEESILGYRLRVPHAGWLLLVNY